MDHNDDTINIIQVVENTSRPIQKTDNVNLTTYTEDVISFDDLIEKTIDNDYNSHTQYFGAIKSLGTPKAKTMALDVFAR